MNWTSFAAGFAAPFTIATIGWWLLGIIDRAGGSRRHFVWHPGVWVAPIMVSVTARTIMLVGRSGWAVWLERRPRFRLLPIDHLGWPRPVQPRDGWPMRWAIVGRVHLQAAIPAGFRLVRQDGAPIARRARS